MLQRLNTEFKKEREGDELRSMVGKFFKDMDQLMTGILDLLLRYVLQPLYYFCGDCFVFLLLTVDDNYGISGQLPDKERSVVMKLLLQITIRESTFEFAERNKAQDWLRQVEGTRQRKRCVFMKCIVSTVFSLSLQFSPFFPDS